MSEERDEAKQGSSGATWAVGLVAALVLYVLSPPIVFHIKQRIPGLDNSHTAENVLLAFYAPLIWLDRFKTTKHTLTWLYDWEEKVLHLDHGL